MAPSPGPLALLQAVPDPAELESPLPGGLAAAVRFFFNFPQPLQIAGIVVGVVVAAVVAFVAWRRRREIWTWLRTRERKVYAAMAGGGLALVLAATASGVAGWHYVQHDNGFCTGCHVMGPSFVRFTQSEHSQLECHDCHTQPISASMRQLYLWVLERPEEIGEHAPVATQVCARCHIQEDPDSTWQRIVATQGHDVHLNRDHEDLGDVQCVTCHGQEVHRFVPAQQTCGQSGCHIEEDTRIVLGEMAGAQTTFHCLNCHQFTAPLAVDDGETVASEAQQAMLPGIEDCGGCHEMEPLLANLLPEDDPHQAVCGLCHNPHEQADPAAAFQTCTTSGCHADPASLSPFHRGIDHGVVDDCAACHDAHRWVVDGSDCRSCHTVLTQ